MQVTRCPFFGQDSGMTRANVLAAQKKNIADGCAWVSAGLTPDGAEAISRVRALFDAPMPHVHQRMVEIGGTHMAAARGLLETVDPDLAEDPCAVACLASMCAMRSLNHYANEDPTSGGMPPQ